MHDLQHHSIPRIAAALLVLAGVCARPPAEFDAGSSAGSAGATQDSPASSVAPNDRAPLTLRALCELPIGPAPLAVSRNRERIAYVAPDGDVFVVSADAPSHTRVASGATSVALDAAAGPVWFGTGSGVLVRHDSSGAEQRFDLATGGAIDGLVAVGGHVAWSCSASGSGGVVEAWSGITRISVADLVDPTFAGPSVPWLQLAPDGATAVGLFEEQIPTADGGGSTRALRVLDVRTGEERARVCAYAAHSRPGHVLLPDVLVHGTRTERGFALERVDHVLDTRVPLAATPRGGHFIDLVAAPSGRFLLEGDFEDDGVLVVDIRGEHAAVRLAARGHVPVGFVVESNGDEIAATVDMRTGALALWTLAGAPRAVARDAFAGRRVESVGNLQGGTRAYAILTAADGGERRLVVFAIESGD